MAFVQFKLDKIINQSRDIFSTYIYETDDTLTEVTTSGYFAASRFANDDDWQGSVIQCNCADGFFMLQVSNGAVSVSQDQSFTGWGVYSDTALTEGSPLSLVANTQVDLPNNAGSKLELQLPPDVLTFYDGTVITGRSGDGVNLTISFAVKPTTNQSTRITLVPDIGGAVGEIEDYAMDSSFSRGQNVVQRYLSSFNAYTLDTWEANGATLKITSDNAADIFNVRYLITRTHKAR